MRRLKIVLRLAFSYYFMLIILDSKSGVFHLKIQKNFSNSLGAENKGTALTFQSWLECSANGPIFTPAM